MKKTLGVVALLLTACGGTETVYVTATEAPDTTTKVVKTTDAPIAPAWTAEDEFLYDIHSEVGNIGVSDRDLLDTGYLVCDSLRAGAQAWDVATALDQSATDYYTQKMLIALTASAVLNFCPDQLWKFE
jgi:Protein of unknown function (DUF732)